MLRSISSDTEFIWRILKQQLMNSLKSIRQENHFNSIRGIKKSKTIK